MKVRIISERLYNGDRDTQATVDLNKAIDEIERQGNTIIDIKMEPWLQHQHNTGDNTAFMQYLIMYKRG